jgi:hypothetical protein
MTNAPFLRRVVVKLQRLTVALVLACVAATLVVSAGQTPPRRHSGAVGGTGGTHFFSRCPDGQMVVGLAGRSGTIIDRVAPLCVALSMEERWIGEPIEGPGAGGPGGGPFRAVCPRDMVVTQFSGLGGEFVVNLRLACSFPARRDVNPTWLATVGGQTNVGSTAGGSCEGDNTLSSAITGASGQFVNRFALACDVGFIAGAPTKIPPTAGDGSLREVPPRVVVPPKKTSSTFATGIFAIAESGDLLFSTYMGLHNASNAWVRRNVPFGVGWGFKHVFSAGDGVIIAITQEGKVLYYKCQCLFGAPSWIVADPRVIAEGWPDYMRVFSGGHGIIYTLDWQGNLYYNSFLGMEDGSPRWGVTRKRIANRWTDIADAFAGGDDGTIYAITNFGELLYFHYDGLSTGDTNWSVFRKSINAGWKFRHVFSPGGGVILAVEYDGTMRWYKHVDLNGKVVWDPRSRTVIADGFANMRHVFSYH